MIVAQFPSGAALGQAARTLRQAGIPAETRSPIALPEDEHAGSRLPTAVLIAGLAGAALGFGMQCYATMVSYPLIIGARPNFFWTSFIVFAFECGVLAATGTAFIGYLVSCRLPWLYDPSDECDALRDATRDGYFLVVRNQLPEARQVLGGMDPVRIMDTPG